MRYLSEKITDYIIKSGAISGESYEIYQYGFQIGLEMGSCFLVSLGIALYLHMIRQFFVFTGVFMLLRTYVGGLHLNSYLGCFICSIAVQTITLLINSTYAIVFPVAWGIILISTVLILKNAPVENINRELDAEEKKHCKEVTMKILASVLIFSIGCTVVGLDSIVSLISMTMLIVSISQYIGMIKYNIEKKGRK